MMPIIILWQIMIPNELQPSTIQNAVVPHIPYSRAKTPFFYTYFKSLTMDPTLDVVLQ